MRRQLLALGVTSITLAAGGTGAPEARAGDPPGPDLNPTSWRAGSVGSGTGFSRADGSERVRETQRRLRALGYRPGPVDGLFGPATEAAVRRFQSKHGLGVDGVVGRETLIELRRASAPPSTSPNGVTQGASRSTPAGWALDRSGPAIRGTGYLRAEGSDRVRRVQRALRRLGYPVGRTDGRLGPVTDSAVRRFQRRQGLEPDGIVGPKTLVQLTRSTSEGATTGELKSPRGARAASGRAQPRIDASRSGPSGDSRWTWALAALLGALTLLGLLLLVVARRWGRLGHARRVEHGLYVQGQGERVGSFAGVVIVFGHARSEDGAGERTYLVDDSRRIAPVWVRESELARTSLGPGRRAELGQLAPAHGRENGSARPATNGQPREEENGSARPATNGQPREEENGSARPATNGQPPGEENGSARPATNGQPRQEENGSARPATNGQPREQEGRPERGGGLFRGM